MQTIILNPPYKVRIILRMTAAIYMGIAMFLVPVIILEILKILLK